MSTDPQATFELFLADYRSQVITGASAPPQTASTPRVVMVDSACGEVGVAAPVIDRNRCEGKADCVRVCPYGVFSIRRLEPDERAGLSLIGRLKAWGHGYKQAFVNPELCHNCGLCVPACPEKAIRL